MEEFKEANLRSLLKQLRTDIAMAVDDSFPLVNGLADRNIIPDELQKVSDPASMEPNAFGHKSFEGKLFLQDTLEKESKEGIHKAMYSLLSWVLQQRRSIIRAFWSNLSKDYNLDSYPKLQKLITNLPSGTSARGNLCAHYNLSVGPNLLNVLKMDDSAGSRDEKRSSGNQKTSHVKKRNHEDSQQPQHHDKPSEEPGNGFFSQNALLLRKMFPLLNVKAKLHIWN